MLRDRNRTFDIADEDLEWDVDFWRPLDEEPGRADGPEAFAEPDPDPARDAPTVAPPQDGARPRRAGPRTTAVVAVVAALAGVVLAFRPSGPDDRALRAERASHQDAAAGTRRAARPARRHKAVVTSAAAAPEPKAATPRATPARNAEAKPKPKAKPKARTPKPPRRTAAPVQPVQAPPVTPAPGPAPVRPVAAAPVAKPKPQSRPTSTDEFGFER